MQKFSVSLESAQAKVDYKPTPFWIFLHRAQSIATNRIHSLRSALRKEFSYTEKKQKK